MQQAMQQRLLGGTHWFGRPPPTHLLHESAQLGHRHPFLLSLLPAPAAGGRQAGRWSEPAEVSCSAEDGL